MLNSSLFGEGQCAILAINVAICCIVPVSLEVIYTYKPLREQKNMEQYRKFKDKHKKKKKSQTLNHVLPHLILTSSKRRALTAVTPVAITDRPC